MGAVYTQLSLQERRKIEDWWHAKVPVREMARALKRHKSTIFREIKRNFWADESLPKRMRNRHHQTLVRRGSLRTTREIKKIAATSPYLPTSRGPATLIAWSTPPVTMPTLRPLTTR
ncbi:MAG: helix-turn-helix domain-containing protein [Pelagibaca sp.]